jgi:hypothetical protein
MLLELKLNNFREALPPFFLLAFGKLFEFAELHAEHTDTKSPKSLENKGFPRFEHLMTITKDERKGKFQRAEKPSKIKGF